MSFLVQANTLTRLISSRLGRKPEISSAPLLEDVRNSKGFITPNLSLNRSRASQQVGVRSLRAARVGTIAPTQTINGSLSKGDRRNPQRRGSFADNFRLAGVTPGQKIRLNLNSRAFDTLVQVVNAKTGRAIAQNDDLRRGITNSSLTFTVRPNIDYLVRVTSYRGGVTGRYTLISRDVTGVPLFNFDSGYGLVNVAAAVAAAKGQSLFSDVPNVPNDWGLNAINAPEVWAQGDTGQGVIVAVLDTGVDYLHSDLADNIWTNPGEIPNNRIDDDLNGFVDDVNGWNFVDGGNNNPMDTDGHGTHISGTIAALNNGFGVTGVAPNAKIMPIRVIGGLDDRSLIQFDENVAEGIRYAVENGAKVLNLSLGNFPGDPTMPLTRVALQSATQRGVVAVMASGNERSQGATRPIEPAFFAGNGLGIAVGAIDSSQRVADFSNPAGNRAMPFVVAPGVNIRSTLPGDQYSPTDWSGTSMATAFVSGVVALTMSANPSLTPAQISNILISTANSKVSSPIA